MKKLFLLLAMVGLMAVACTPGGVYDGNNGNQGNKNNKKPANNEIWYTSSDGNIATPSKTDVFGANIVSNTYENGKGVIVFDAPVTSIGEQAFRDCSSLTSVTIPDSVTSIGEQAFYGCSSLTSVTIGNSVTSIGSAAFYECSSLTSVTIPDGVTSIRARAFYCCSSLTSVTIPDSVTSIGNSAFYFCNGELIINSKTLVEKDYTSSNYPTYNGWLYCNSFTKLTIGDNITKIGDYAFRDCSSLTSVTIPDSVTSIGARAFYCCSSLTSVIIPDSVTSIEYSAFENCSSLTSATIGNSVTSIGWDAFNGCSSLTSVYCKPTTPPTGDYYMFDDNASGRKIYVPRNSVDAYKSTSYWSDYADYIVGYDF